MKKNKILTALLSLIIAFGLWAYVITVVRPGSEEIYRDVHVSLDGERLLTEKGLMLVDGEDATVTLTISGNRSDLNKINPGNISVVADLTKIWTPGVKQLKYDYSFPGDIAEDAVSVQRRDPDSITVVVAQREKKVIPVVINYVGTIADPNSYIVDKENAVLDQAGVSVTGPDTVIDQIDHAEIEVDLTGRTTTINESYRITLCDREGNGVDSELVTVDTAEVNLELRIQQVKDLPVVVTVVNGGGATQNTSKIEIDPVSIRVAGSSQLLSKITELNIGTVDLGKMPKDEVLTFPIVLEEGLTNLTGVKEVSVKVSFPNLRTKEFTVSSFQAINVPEGMVGEIIPKVLTVSLRGPNEIIGKMLSSDVVVVVDFANADAGNSTIKATIKVNPKYPEVGAVGSYSVPVTLLAAEDIPETTGE